MPRTINGSDVANVIAAYWSKYIDPALDPVQHLKEYGFPQQWDGCLYRTGDSNGIYYHAAEDGAEYYASREREGMPVLSYPLPAFSKVLLINIEEDNDWLEKQIGESSDDIALDLEAIMPKLRAKGYDGVIIHGETGADVSGPSIEVVDLTKWRQ